MTRYTRSHGYHTVMRSHRYRPILVILLVLGQRLNAQASANEQRMAEREQQIEDENQRTQEIGDLEEYMQSDEYLEKVAKDKLGLIKDGEIIFKESGGE